MTKSKLGRVLLSAAIAFALWLYVITVVNPNSEDTYYNIPVALQGEALLENNGMMIITEEKPTVTLVLSGNRSDLNKVNSSNITVVADLSKIYEAGIAELDYSISFPGDIAYGALSVQSRYPDSVVLEVERKIQKEIPVNIQYKGSVSTDFIVDKENKILDYSMVTIAGPQSVIDQITQAIIEVDLEGRNVSFSESYRYTLCDAEGKPVDAEKVDTNVAEVNLTLYIQRVKELPLVVTVVDGGGATEDTSDIKLEPSTIKVSGSDIVLEGLTELNLGTINLGELLQDTTLEFPINLPAGVTSLTPDLHEISVVVKFPDLITKTLTVNEIQAVNVPEGMEVEFLTQTLNVKVRGDSALVSRMSASNIIVTVDFASAQLGSYTVKPTITMKGAYSKVGAIGNYSVSVTLREAVAEEEP